MIRKRNEILEWNILIHENYLSWNELKWHRTTLSSCRDSQSRPSRTISLKMFNNSSSGLTKSTKRKHKSRTSLASCLFPLTLFCSVGKLLIRAIRPTTRFTVVEKKNINCRWHLFWSYVSETVELYLYFDKLVDEGSYLAKLLLCNLNGRLPRQLSWNLSRLKSGSPTWR